MIGRSVSDRLMVSGESYLILYPASVGYWRQATWYEPSPYTLGGWHDGYDTRLRYSDRVEWYVELPTINKENK